MNNQGGATPEKSEDNSDSVLADFDATSAKQPKPPEVKPENKAPEDAGTVAGGVEGEKPDNSAEPKAPAKKKAAAKKKTAAKSKPEPKQKAKVPAKEAKAPAKKKAAVKKAAAKKKPPQTKTKAKAKTKAKSSGGGRVILRKGELLFVDPRKIVVEDGFNPRIDFGEFEELKNSIKSEGVQQPIRVRRNSRNQLSLVDGERRLRATLALLEEGVKAGPIPAIEVNPKDDSDALLQACTANTGKNLTPVEEADAFRRLVEMGFTPEQLVERTGKSLSTVRGRLTLIDAGESVRKALNKGDISVGQAKKIVRAAKGKDEKQDKLVKETVKAKKSSTANKSLQDSVSAASKQKISGNRARELLFEVASARSKFERSRKPPSSMNKAYVALEKVEKKLVKMKRNGLLRP